MSSSIRHASLKPHCLILNFIANQIQELGSGTSTLPMLGKGKGKGALRDEEIDLHLQLLNAPQTLLSSISCIHYTRIHIRIVNKQYNAHNE
jgi:hypothetical protein